jgi:hypothetical protein
MKKEKLTARQLHVKKEFKKCPKLHQKLMVEIYRTLRNFNNEFSEDYDISVTTARDLQRKTWQIINILPHDIFTKMNKYD